MATVKNLRPSILTLNLIDQIQLIKKTRLSRRTSKFVAKKKRKAQAKKRKSPMMKKSISQLAALLSPAQKAALRAELLGV